MSESHNLNLDEARRLGRLDLFVKNHPSQADERCFQRLLLQMAKMPPEADQTSDPDTSAC